jgi:hypothetical protein
MRRVICQVLLVIAGACLVWQVTLTGLDVGQAGRVILIFLSVMVMVFLPRLRLKVGRWLRPLLIAVGIALVVLLVVVILQSEELRLALQALIAYIGDALRNLVPPGGPLPLVIAILALIVFGVLCARRPTSSA